MHELGIVFYAIKQVEQAAKENNVSQVSKVTLEVGEVSTIVPSYFRDCWKWAVARTEHMKNCVLDLIVLKAITYCEDCQKTYGTVEHGKICPFCGSERTYLVSGTEINIKSIEAS